MGFLGGYVWGLYVWVCCLPQLTRRLRHDFWPCIRASLVSMTSLNGSNNVIVDYQAVR